MNLIKTYFDTPLGQMIAIADERALYRLAFVNPDLGLINHTVVSGRTKPIDSIEHELQQYFSGKLTEFKTPIVLTGTPFRNRVWQALQDIPFGQTCSYLHLAKAIGKPTACRAVAQANGANHFVVIIPCHRVINASGALGGYSAGLERKKWLLDHEKSMVNDLR